MQVSTQKTSRDVARRGSLSKRALLSSCHGLTPSSRWEVQATGTDTPKCPSTASSEGVPFSDKIALGDN
ncbi:hypothetical protein A2U01_0010699 [Trifolium medium]|uniref:Uncharacterized protein n=1 Tax=Trifolium medium TaxID=97028 RepID=A0A392MT17_9FABA|nr:hypothetical protein [Trifolium medium]